MIVKWLLDNLIPHLIVISWNSLITITGSDKCSEYSKTPVL